MPTTTCQDKAAQVPESVGGQSRGSASAGCGPGDSQCRSLSQLYMVGGIEGERCPVVK